MRPVLEIRLPEGFDLWPVIGIEQFAHLALHGEMTPQEVGTAIAAIATHCDWTESHFPPRPVDPVGSFVHGLRHVEVPCAAGGLRLVDGTTGTTLLPGCCNHLAERRDWNDVLDGSGRAIFGHNPTPVAERRGDVVALTIDGDRPDSPLLDVPVTELRGLLAGAERDLVDFLALTTDWLPQQLPDHAAPLRTAIARALALPPD